MTRRLKRCFIVAHMNCAADSHISSSSIAPSTKHHTRQLYVNKVDTIYITPICFQNYVSDQLSFNLYIHYLSVLYRFVGLTVELLQLYLLCLKLYLLCLKLYLLCLGVLQLQLYLLCLSDGVLQLKLYLLCLQLQLHHPFCAFRSELILYIVTRHDTVLATLVC